MSLSLVFNPFTSTFDYVDNSGLTVFATGTSGSDFNIDYAGNTVTFNIPIADASTTGKLSATDWTRFDFIATSGITGITDTNSINLTNTSQNVSADLLLSASAAPGSGIAVINQINSDGLQGYVTISSVTGLFSAVAPLVDTNGQFSIPQATTGVDGYLASGDFTTFNNKQPAGNYIVALTGDVVASGPGTVAATIQTNVVTNAKLAQAPALTLKGNNTTGTTDELDLTVSQVNTMLGDVTLIGTYDSQSAVADALSITGNSLFAQSASTGFPGMVSTGAQTFAGDKTFAGNVIPNIDNTYELGRVNPADPLDVTNRAWKSVNTFMIYGGSYASIDPYMGFLYDTTGATAVSNITVSYSTRRTIDSSGTPSLDWNNRQLLDPGEAAALVWNSSGIEITKALFLDGSNSGVFTVQAASTTIDYTLTLPPAQGASTQYPANDGSGILSWVTPNTASGDLTPASASIANNQTGTSVAGLAFSNSVVRSAKIQYSLYINATASLYEEGEIAVVQRGADWAISQQNSGDDSLVVFDVSNAGQVTYTTPSYSGFTSGKMQYRAFVTAI